MSCDVAALQRQVLELISARQQSDELYRELTSQIRELQEDRNKIVKELDDLRFAHAQQNSACTQNSELGQSQQHNGESFSVQLSPERRSRCGVADNSRGADSPVAAKPTRVTNARREVYIKVGIGMGTHMCLLDSGADVAVVPTAVARGYPVEPVTCRLTTADGRTYEATGRVVLTVMLGHQKLVVNGLVSDHIDEITLGEEWLQNNKALWDHHRRRVRLNGVWHKLCASDASDGSRQVRVSRVTGDNVVAQPQRTYVVSKEKKRQLSGPAGQTTGLSNDVLSAAQQTDRYIARVYSAVASGRPKPQWKEVAHWSVQERFYWCQWDRLAMRDEVLCRKFETAGGRRCIWQVLLPENCRAEAISAAHSSATGGHRGRSRTEERIQRCAFWCGWKKDVKSVLRKCVVCAKNRGGTTQAHMTRGVESLAVGNSMKNDAVDVSDVERSSDDVAMRVHQLDEQRRDDTSDGVFSVKHADVGMAHAMDTNDVTMVKQRDCCSGIGMVDATHSNQYAQFIALCDQLSNWRPPQVK
jgi:predicted aspartyl protease